MNNNDIKARIELENLDNPIDISIDKEAHKDILIGYKNILEKYKSGTEEERKLISECLSSGLAYGVNRYICETEGHDYGFWEEVFKDDPSKDYVDHVHKWRKICKRCGSELSTYELPQEVTDLQIRRYTLHKDIREDI